MFKATFFQEWDCLCTLAHAYGIRLLLAITPHPQSCALAKPEFERYGVALVKARVMRKDGDWNCYRCGNINFQVTVDLAMVVS